MKSLWRISQILEQFCGKKRDNPKSNVEKEPWIQENLWKERCFPGPGCG